MVVDLHLTCDVGTGDGVRDPLGATARRSEGLVSRLSRLPDSGFFLRVLDWRVSSSVTGEGLR
jgi:hypothetical protein